MAEKIATASEYKSKRRRNVTLTEGDIFVVRKMSPMVYGNALRAIGVTTEDFNEDGTLVDEEDVKARINKDIIEVMRYVIPRCIVKPKVVSTSEEETESSIVFDDIDEADLTLLINAVYEFSGLGPKETEERKDFPEESVSEPSPKDK